MKSAKALKNGEYSFSFVGELCISAHYENGWYVVREINGGLFKCRFDSYTTAKRYFQQQKKALKMEAKK